jgi:hypothetical protein
MDKAAVSIHGAFLMDPGGGLQHPNGNHHGLGWAAIYSRNTKLTMDGVWGYWGGEFGHLAVGTTLLGDAAHAFPITNVSSINDPLALHHRCSCTVDSLSECDDGQRSLDDKCYLASCPTGAAILIHHRVHEDYSYLHELLFAHPTGHDDGFRGCTCAWKHITEHSPPHGCTGEVHCTIGAADKLPPNCSKQQLWVAPGSTQLLYSWDPRGSTCLNATIACTASVDYHCGASGADGSANPSACEACAKQPKLVASLRMANCTDESIRSVCRGGASLVQRVVQPEALPHATPVPQTDQLGEGELARLRGENEALALRVSQLEAGMETVMKLLEGAA